MLATLVKNSTTIAPPVAPLKGVVIVCEETLGTMKEPCMRMLYPEYAGVQRDAVKVLCITIVAAFTELAVIDVFQYVIYELDVLPLET